MKNRQICRGKVNIRSRSPNSTRLNDPSPFQLFKYPEGDLDSLQPFEEDDYAWLAMEWFFQNGRRMPSKQEILNGILMSVVMEQQNLARGGPAAVPGPLHQPHPNQNPNNP